MICWKKLHVMLYAPYVTNCKLANYVPVSCVIYFGKIKEQEKTENNSNTDDISAKMVHTQVLLFWAYFGYFL